MAQTTTSQALRVQQWDDKYHMEYVRANRFKMYMGKSENSIICVKEDLTKKKGDSITCPLVGALDIDSGPNDGSTELVGNEKALPNDGHRIAVKVVRDATLVNMEQEQYSPINLREASKTALKDMQLRYLRNDIISALGSVNGVNYPVATAAQRNQWHDSNSDRIVYGSANANFVTGDHAASLANINNTSDKLTHKVVSLAKRKAQVAKVANGDGIRPYKYSNDQEMYIMFVTTLAFRDLREDLIANSYWVDAEKRGKENPMYKGPTSVMWDGVMVQEIPEINPILGVGAGGIDVSPGFLCGSQALGVAWAKRTKTTRRKEDDYEFNYGVGFLELRGVDKIRYNQNSASSKDWGMTTVFTSSVPDA